MSLKQPLSPLDGRYYKEVSELSEYLSEAGLNQARLQVEVEWLIFLSDNQIFDSAPLSEENKSFLRTKVTSFSEADIAKLAEIEAKTQHDVKAVENLIRLWLAEAELSQYAELIHFGCTSEDINNLSYALTVKAAIEKHWLPKLESLIAQISELALSYRDEAMLARTHGQPATPTTMGKELAVFSHRLKLISSGFETQRYLGKFSGATGTFAAHLVAEPNQDWPALSKKFVESLGLDWNPLTTQIESHDWQVELYYRIQHINGILHNFCTDIWTYISIGYFVQIPVAGATGSSTMPHKVNPIRFENAEANLELSNAILNSLASTLVTSRLQRDLTDSSSQRNIGVGLGHSLLALNNIARGLKALKLNSQQLLADLDQNWEVLAEAIQTVLRAEIVAGNSNLTNPYDLLKEFTRGKNVNQAELQSFVDSLEISESAKTRLSELTPANYTGLASALLEFLEK